MKKTLLPYLRDNSLKNTANIRIDPAKTSDIATIDAKVPLNPKYFIKFSGGNGNLLAP